MAVYKEEGKRMKTKKIGFIAGILVALIIHFLPLQGIEPAGQTCLALTLMTVVWWATQVAQSGYVGGIYLILLIVLGVAEPELVFKSWTGSTMYLIIGAYLIASAVKDSGLGERIAYAFIIKFVRSYRGILISIFVLTFIMSILIPHPWPRAFLIMSVMAVVVKSAKMPKEDAVKVGFTVFAASVPVSLIFLTGDSIINPLAVANSGVDLDWLGWFKVMGLPAIVASVLTLLLILVLFKPSKELEINLDEVKEKQNSLGPLSTLEKRTAVWLVIAIVLWATDSIHGINIGWVTLGVAMFMSMPVIGEVLTAKSWGEVPVHVLIFLTSAMTIGTVGGATGMNEWLAKTILPSTIPNNPLVLAAFIALIDMIIHMFMGSVIAVMGVAIPALMAFTSPMGINPLVTTLIVYTAVAIHYILPFHHLNMLVGQGEENGMYTQKETIRLGIPLTVVVFIVTVLVEIPWWKLLGML